MSVNLTPIDLASVEIVMSEIKCKKHGQTRRNKEIAHRRKIVAAYPHLTAKEAGERAGCHSKTVAKDRKALREGWTQPVCVCGGS